MTDRYVIAGASGLIGRALTESLQHDGATVIRLVRRPAESPDEVQWLANFEPLDPSILVGSKAVMNFCGASIGRLPWTPGYATELRRSRLRPTRVLADALRALGKEAPAFVSSSAVGFYGDQPGATLDERGAPGDTYLARLCAQWEAAALLAGPDARVALLRTAPLVHADGVLKPLLTLTKLGVSGPLGSGNQVMPWISLEDEVRAIRHIIDEGLTGPVNLTGPTLATSNDLGRALAQRLRRPYVLPVPKWGLRTALGRRAADSLLLADAAVQPTRLVESGFEFEHPTVADAVAAAVPARG